MSMRAGVVILLVFLTSLVNAQDFQYTLRNYKAVDGLPQSQVRILREDRNGYLWVGTLHGLARFDGLHFAPFSKAD